MTTASVTTPEQMRDRLLQAIDCQSNIHNMVAVLDVISNLEKYPITKEVLEETRLGKLINDLRKRTRNEDLAKRAKKLLRNWQKLIEPQQNEVQPKELSTGTSSTVRCSQSKSLSVSRTVQSVIDVDKKSALSNGYSSAEKLRPVNHTSGKKVDENLSTLKVSKTLVRGQISAVSSTSEHVAGSEAFSGGALPTNVTVVKPHLSSSELNKQPSASTVLRTSILQQHGQRDRAASERGQHKSQSHYAPPTLRTVKQLVTTKWPTSLAVSDSEPFSALLLNSSIQASHTESLQPKDTFPQWENESHSEKTLEQTNNSQNKSKCLARLQSGLLSEVTNVETEKDAIPSEGRRRKHQLRDYSGSLDGRSAEDSCKAARVKNRKLTFDPFTQQIRPSAVAPSEEQHSSVVDVNELDSLKQSPSAASSSYVHKTSWKELSQNEIVKYYLNLQNNLLKTSGSQSPGSHFFMTENAKPEEDHVRDSNKTYVLVPSIVETDLPGIGRDITIEDLDRIHNKHWPGVNGCYDSKGNWYGWTQCIPLDSYVDGSKLNILPYVCID